MAKKEKAKSRKNQSVPQSKRSTVELKKAAPRSGKVSGEIYRGMDRAFDLIAELPEEILYIRNGKDV